MSKSWGDIASQLDANMPQAQYDALREKYFNDVVSPKIRPGFSTEATKQQFLKQTERPSTISPTDKFLVKAGQFSSAAVKAMVPGEGGRVLTQELDKSIAPIAEREGITSPTLEMVGSFIGQGIALEALLPAAGAITKMVLPSAIEGGRTAVVAQKLARGGLAFATYDALEAKDGDRVAAGLKGAAIGVAGEAVLGKLFGFGEKATAAHTMVKDAVTNEAPPAIQETVAEGLTADTQAAKVAGVPKKPVEIKAGKPGLRITLADENGNVVVQSVPKGQEDEAISLIRQTLDRGGDWDIDAHPASMARAGKIVRAFTDSIEADANPSNLTKLNENLRGALNQKDFPDELSWKAYQLGELRHQVREAGANKIGGSRSRGGTYAPGSPSLSGEGHRVMNDLARDVGQDFGLYNRDEAGDQALVYWNKVRGSTGNIESISDHMARYSGTGKYDWSRGDMPQFGMEKIDPEGGNLTSNLRPVTRRESIHGDIPKGRGKEFLKPPPSETMPIVADIEGRVKERPIGTTKVLPAGTDIASTQGGTVTLSEDATRATVYHERVHQGITAAGAEQGFGIHIPNAHFSTAGDLALGIKTKFAETYKDLTNQDMLNEAFTHAAEAIRVGNVGALDELGKMDTDPETVKAFVNGTAGNLWEQSLARDTAPVRAFQRRMVDLVRRTSDAPSLALREAQTTGWRTWYDPEISQWVMQDGDGRTVMKGSVRDVWDHIHEHDASDSFPDVAHKAYFRGKFGPSSPGVSGPSASASVSPEAQTPELGWQSVRALWAPTEASASGVARKLKEAGQEALGQQYFDAFKGALDNDRLGREWHERLAKQYGTIMKDVPYRKSLDYGETLAHGEQHWADVASKLKLSTGDLANVRAFAELDKKIVADGGISPVEVLETMKRVRASGDAALTGDSPIIKAMNSGALAMNDMNLGSVTTWALREGATQKFTADSLDAIDALAKTRDESGKLVFGPMQYSMGNFTRHMRGNKDQSQKLIDSLLTGMVGSVEKRGVQVGMKPGWTKQWGIGDPRGVLQTYMKWMAVANLGGRPVSFVRDAVSGLLQLSVGGPRMFAEGVSLLMSKEGRAAAEKYLINESDVAGYFGDTTGDLAVGKGVAAFNRVADIALAPTRLGNQFPRMIAGLGEEARAMREISHYRAGTITADELMDNTGAWFQDPAPKTRLVAIAQDPSIPISKAAEAFGRAFNDATQFSMQRGAQGAAFRTGAGKLLGQYGTWPANYMNFVRKLAARSLENPKNGVPALATFTAMSYGTLKAAQALSVDVSNWLFFSPIGYSGSPTLSLLQAAASAPEETQAGRDARKELIKSISQGIVPLGTQFRSMMKAFEPDGTVNVPRLLGFKPLKEQDQDWDEWFRSETGLGK